MKYDELKQNALCLNIINTISHQFKTPLHTISTLVYLLNEDEELSKSTKLKLDIIKNNCMHLSNITEDLSGIFGQKKSSEKDNHETINIATLLKKTSFSYSSNLNKNAIILDSVPKYNGVLYGNKTILKQIINTVLANTLSYTTNGVITIAASLEKTTADVADLTIKISDSEYGVDTSARQSIYTNAIIKESISDKSFNLSLTLLRKSIASCNGTLIKIPSDTENSFVFKIPLEYKYSVNFSYYMSGKTATKSAAILLVEDNKVNQRLTQNLLLKHGYRCDVADNGKEAIEKVVTNTYDLVLMDIMMPVMDGFEATTKIRKLNNSLPIIALTAKTGREIREFGFDGVVDKPFSIDTFFEKIESHTKKRVS